MPGRLSAVLCLVAAISFAADPKDPVKLGHSMHGSAFDSGPRQKPWVIEGIGESPFPITTKNPEVQKWFNQGNALLHSFWFYEAERAFRWCLKLEPENAMAFWGLARAAGDERGKDFLREAVKRKDTVTERERLYIEALEVQDLPDPLRDKNENGHDEQIKKLETLCIKYPDDLEAKSMLALATMGRQRYGTELLIREILAKAPQHPGAHHYRIHNWDYHEPEQALVSCPTYTKIASGIGHALHMPGHIYSIVGMWNEAAISMDAATRAEKRYMKESLTFPFNNWNYAHNRTYLCYIQEQLGMADAAIFGARQLLDAPLDPKDNTGDTYGSHYFGAQALPRALVKFERWDELLDDKAIPWRDSVRDKMNKAYFEARAWLGKRDLGKAEKAITAHGEIKLDDKNKDLETVFTIQKLELKGRLAIMRGQEIVGLGLLADAAQREFDLQREYADPPIYPEALFNTLGDAYLDSKSPVLAAKAYEKALELTKNDLFALSGAVRAYAALGEKDKAEAAMARLLYVTAGADQGLKIVERAKATGITATAKDSSPGEQRNYARAPLEQYGPARWDPYDAPALDVLDSKGKKASLSEYKGKNVILVFYLGSECAHCMKQLHDIGNKKDDWERLSASVLAVSSTEPAKNAKGLKELGELPIRLLSDKDFVNARRFHSYDDFEDTELHSTILIDKKGRVYWARIGGDPFSDMEFLTKQLERMNALVEAK